MQDKDRTHNVAFQCVFHVVHLLDCDALVVQCALHLLQALSVLLVPRIACLQRTHFSRRLLVPFERRCRRLYLRFVDLYLHAGRSQTR